jgi:hypothetical protein
MEKKVPIGEKKKWYKTWWGIILIVIFWIWVIGKIIPSNSDFQTTPPLYSLDDIKQNAQSIPYDDLFRYSEKYIESPLTYEGEIIQFGGSSGDYYYRIDITKKVNAFSTTYDDTIYVTYKGTKRFLEKDIVKFYGVGKGTVTYKTVLGAQVEIPSIYALDIDLIQKAGER